MGEKKCLYKKKKNVQKNRKIVKNLLMYDKKNFLPLHTKKVSPPKNKNRPLNIKFKKRKRMKKIRKNQRKILKFSLFLTSRMVKLRKEKNQNKNKITGL